MDPYLFALALGVLIIIYDVSIRYIETRGAVARAALIHDRKEEEKKDS